MNDDRLFFIVHLQKSAGTTLRDRFRASLPDRAIYPHKCDGDRVGHLSISVSHLLERWKVRRDEIRVIGAHFPLSTVELLDADFVTLSVLRPPVERTLSYLRHQTQKSPGRVSDGSLEDVYNDPFKFAGLIRNHATRMFGIGSDEMAAGDGVLTDVEDSAELLDRAKAGVASLDDFGLQPRFDEFWERLATTYGLDSTASVVSNTTEPEAAPTDLIDRIIEDNALDLELYQFAEELYRSRHG